MVSKTIVAVMLVSALAFLPGASALNADIQNPDLGFDISPVTGAVDAQVATAKENAGKVMDQVEDQLDCQILAKVPVYIQYGDFSDVVHEEYDFLVERTVVTAVEYREVPILATETRTIWTPTGLLGFLEPITEEVEVVTGYETEKIVTTENVPFRVDTEWDRQRIEWGAAERMTFYMPVPSAALFLDDGAKIEHVCEDVEVTEVLPNFGRNGHDRVRWSVGYKWYADESWRTIDWDVSIRQANEGDMDLPRRAGYSFCPTQVIEEIDAALDGIEESFRPMVTKDRDGSQVSTQGTDTHAGEAALVVPGSTLAFLAVLAAAVVGLAGFLGYKHFRREEE